MPGLLDAKTNKNKQKQTINIYIYYYINNILQHGNVVVCLFIFA